jgi:hypothetical protein
MRQCGSRNSKFIANTLFVLAIALAPPAQLGACGTCGVKSKLESKNVVGPATSEPVALTAADLIASM